MSNNLAQMSDEDFLKDDVFFEEESEITEPEEKRQPSEVDDNFHEDTEEGNTELDTEEEEEDLDDKPESSSPGSEDKPTTVDYKQEYSKVFEPLKANGTTLEIKTPEEARQLMQMGANFTKKMQEIAPYRKVIEMLKKNDLLDEGKLSFLIDLDKKNPGAIQHLIKESDIDPLDIDTSEETSYVPNNHSVSDNEIKFKETLDIIRSEQDGQSSIQMFNGWDPESKAKLWDYPELMTVIHQQRRNGVYDQIVTEIERRKAFGQIPANVSFIDAYTHVGNELHSGNQQQQRRPVARKAAVTNTGVMNNRAARAASTPRVNKGTASKTNYVNLSDEDFMKQFENTNY